MQLTTSYQLVGQSSMGVQYGETYYQNVYMKYARTSAQESSLKSTIWTKVTISKTGSNTGAYGTWIGTFNGFYSDTYSAYGRLWTDTALEVQLFERSTEVQHNSNGVYSTTLGATNMDGPVPNHSPSGFAAVAITLPQIILAPTISISGAGSSSSNKLTMSGNTNMSVVLTNSNNLSTTISLTSQDGTKTYNLGTKSANGTYTMSVPISLWNDFTTSEDIVLILKATNTKGTGTTNCYVTLASSVIPTVSMAVTAVNTISQFSTYYVKGLTKAKITMTGSSVYGASIVRAGSAISDTAITNVLLSADRFEISHDIPYSGTVNIAGKVGDARNRSSNLVTSTINVIDYYEPYLTWTVKRCRSNGTLDEEGTYGLITATYDIAPVNNGSSNLNTKKIEYSLNNSTWTTITTTQWSGTVTKIVGGSFSTSSKYTIYIRISDRNKTNVYSAEISPSFTTVSIFHGGKGITIGQVATAEEFNVYMETHLRDGLYIGDTLVLYDDGN